jgi:uncharacterized membrane protein YjfL (UPF0719 family)
MILGIAIVIDFLYLFQQIQSEDGFDITGIKNTNWSTVAIITLVGAVIGIAVYFISKTVIQKRKVKVA